MILIIFITGCQPKPTDAEIAFVDPIPTIKEATLNEEADILYPVDNSGGSFSQEDLIYFIMIDRFYDGDKTNNNFEDIDKNNLKKFHGGDLKGIIDKLDYIQSLGATAIWLTPVFKNEPNGYHGYWAYDFYNVDPHFGTMDELKQLVDEAHERDIKVMLDHIVNHTGYNHPWLDDPEKSDWFHPKVEITNWKDQNQVENGWLAGLPDLDQEHPEVRQYLLDNTLWWIQETGIDGMRIDTMRHVPRDFWNEFAKTIKDEYPNFYLLGEVWNSNPRYLELYHQVGIDGMTNYSLFDGIVNTFRGFGKTGPLISALSREKNFSKPHLNGIFIDNHDNQRFITAAGSNGKDYLKQALTFIMTYKAIPIIYYGTEIGMEGGNDPDNRRFMEWERTNDSDILSFYKKLVDLRQNNEVMQSGDFTLLSYDDYFISYMRHTDKKSFLIIMNIQNNEKDVTIDIHLPFENFTNILNNQVYSSVSGKLDIHLDPLDLLILESN